MLTPPIGIPNYRLIEPIGKGGMGVVWLGQQHRPKRKVAVKIVAPGNDIPPALLDLLHREGDIAAKFQHAHLVTVHECGLIDDHYYMVMELLPGGDLADRIRTGIGPNETLEVAKNIASALAHIHARGFVHRDLKPSNVLFTAEGSAVLTDFGISKAMDTEGLMTRLGFTTGTPAYMSPEQINGKSLDGRCDLYALGIVMFEMLTGRLPFDADSDHELKQLQLTASTPNLTGNLSYLQPTLERLLAKDPQERIGDAESLIRELNGLAEVPDNATQVVPKLNWQQTVQQRTIALNALARSRFFRPGVLAMLAIATLVIALISLTLPLSHDREPSSTGESSQAVPARVPSIAVLPFDDMSPAKDQAYFSEGLSDTLIHDLAQLSGLKVTAKTSSYSFKGKDDTIADIARQLQIQYVLEGSVQKSGSQIRVIAQLVNAGDGNQLWSKRFDRELQDIFEVQDEIAQQVVTALRVSLLDAEAEQLAKRYRPPLEAYEKLMLGRQEANRNTAESLAAAERHFQQAIEIDPGYALAYVGLANTYNFQVGYADLDMQESIERRQPLLEKALTLDPLSSEAYAARAFLHLDRQDYQSAESDLQKAIDLNPNYAMAYQWYSIVLRRQGRFQEALAKVSVAAILDPLAPYVQDTLAAALWRSGRAEEALTVIRRNMDSNPGLQMNFLRMSSFQAHLGHLDKAQSWIDEARKRNPEGTRAWLDQCIGHIDLGDPLAAEDCANQLGEAHPGNYHVDLVLAELHTYRGEWEAAIATRESILKRVPHVVRAQTWILADLIARRGDLDGARRMMADRFPGYLDDAVVLNPADLGPALTFAAILHANGEIGERDVLLQAMETQIATMHRMRGTGYGPLDAYIHAIRGERRRAINSLRDAIDAGWKVTLIRWWQLREDWKLDSLHSDPEFVALIDQLEAEVSEQRRWYEENKHKSLF